MNLNRRSFLKNSCKACGAMALAGSTMSVFESCSSIPVYKSTIVKNFISIPVSELSLVNKKIIRASGIDYDVLVIKKDETHFKALVMKCTHEDWLLSAGEKSINCTAHGSTFDFDGNVTNGPAIIPLTNLLTTTKENIIYIQIPL